MYLPYYNAIQTLLKQNLSTLKTIDWYNRQYERYEDMKAVALPAAYIEFENTLAWQDTGNKVQLADTTLSLHLVQFHLGDSPETIMELAQATHLAVHGKALAHENRKISTSLARSESELITAYDQLKVMKLTYHTALMDGAAMPEYSKRKTGLGVESH